MISICCGATMNSDSDICPDCKEHTDSEYENSTEAYNEGFYDGFKECKKLLKEEFYERAKRDFLHWNAIKRDERKKGSRNVGYWAMAKAAINWMEVFNNRRIR